MKKILIPVLSFLICFTIIWKWTFGFSAFTIFSYKLQAAGDIPRVFPDIPLINQKGEVFHIKEKHKYVLVNFVYLNCPYVCHKVNNQLEHIYHLFDRFTISSKLEFVTVSFDLQNDGLEKIRKYRNYFGSDIDGWSFALPYQSSQESFNQFLGKIGIWKYTIPGTGIINHSIYLFLVSPDNKVIKVFDPARESDKTIVEQINSCL
ncbi:MAG: SCO family protein [Bacteroidetes bacterium]|nr:SCO family protein [Bacteroidota bacterium]MBS1932311.1 SCO family protein [Bacteroidota bacterium]